MKTTAFIPARGGSKGLPGKNIMHLDGWPLLAYAIRAARNAEGIDEIVVSTEDPRIGAAAMRFGAAIHARAPYYAGDEITSEMVIAEWIAPIRKEERPDRIIFLQCTAPLMLSKDIEGCLRVIDKTDCDACCCCAPFHGVTWTEDNLPHGKRLPRQQRQYNWLEAGSVYAFTFEAFRKSHSRFGTNCGVYEIPADRCFEIDTLLDLKICELILQNKGFSEAMEVEDGLFELGS